MIVGICPNYSKPELHNFVDSFITKLQNAEFQFVLSDSVLKIEGINSNKWNGYQILNDEELAKKCDVIISIGGDGTLLQTAYSSRFSQTPLLGVNFGKLGFLAEFETRKIGFKGS